MSPPLVPPALDFRKVAESVPNLVWTCRGDGPCDYLSPQWLAYTGRPVEEQLGYGWLDAVHPDDRAQTFERWSEAVAAKGPLDTEFRIRRFDGVYRWFTTRAVPELDQHGAIARWYGTNTDIQERRDAEAELHALRRTLEHRVGERTAALMETRVQLEMAQRITHTGSWSFDVRAGHVRWSDELFRVFGLPVSDVCPQYEEQEVLFHPDSWPVLHAAVQRAVTEGIPYNLELRLADSSAGPRYAVTQCEIARAADGSVARLYGTFRDVTELVKARRERDAALERIALATSFAGIGIYEWNLDANTAVWNDQMFRLFDVPADTEPSYDVWLACVAPNDRERLQRSLGNVVQSRLDFTDGYDVVHRDGTVRSIRTVARLTGDANGDGRRLIGICIDVTAEVEAARLRGDSIRLLREFVRNAPAAIAMFDRDLHYLEASERWSEMYGLTGSHSAGRSHASMRHEDADSLRRVHEFVLQGASVGEEETPFRRADGSVRYLDWEARPWHTEAGGIGGSVLFTYDVTERVALRQAVERQAQELLRSNEDLQQFAYAASHDLQEPLRAVSGFAQILGRRYAGHLDAGADELIRHLTEGAERMRDLIDGLLLFSRAGSSTLRRVPVSLDTVIADARANLAQVIGERDARITAEPLPELHLDRSLMVQVFQNLLGNAIKYAGDRPPQVEITARSADDGVEIVVRDHGIGVPASAAERVFQIFQRLHTRDEYPGSGIGLALCRRIVTRHGGRIWITQPDGGGCAVHCWLPMIRPDDHAA